MEAFWSVGICCQQLLFRIVGKQCWQYLWISSSHWHIVSGKEQLIFPPQCNILRLWAPQTNSKHPYCVSVMAEVSATKTSQHQNQSAYIQPLGAFLFIDFWLLMRMKKTNKQGTIHSTWYFNNLFNNFIDIFLGSVLLSLMISAGTKAFYMHMVSAQIQAISLSFHLSFFF